MNFEERFVGILREGATLETAPANEMVKPLGRVGPEAKTRGAEAMRPESFVRSGPMQS